MRRALKTFDKAAGVTWLQRHLLSVSEPLLSDPWILDVDVTVQPIDGHQEGAVLQRQPAQGRAALAQVAYSPMGVSAVWSSAIRMPKPTGQTRVGLYELRDAGRLLQPPLEPTTSRGPPVPSP